MNIRNTNPSYGQVFYFFIVIAPFPVLQSILTVAFVYSRVNTALEEPPPCYSIQRSSTRSARNARTSLCSESTVNAQNISLQGYQSRYCTPAETDNLLPRLRAVAHSPAIHAHCTQQHHQCLCAKLEDSKKLCSDELESRLRLIDRATHSQAYSPRISKKFTRSVDTCAVGVGVGE